MSRLFGQLLKEFCKIFPELWPFENFDVIILSARFLEN